MSNDYRSKMVSSEEAVGASKINDVMQTSSNAKNGRGWGSTSYTTKSSGSTVSTAESDSLYSSTHFSDGTQIMKYDGDTILLSKPSSGSALQSSFINSVLQIAEDASNGALDPRCSDCSGACVTVCTSGCAATCTSTCSDSCSGSCSKTCTSSGM